MDTDIVINADTDIDRGRKESRGKHAYYYVLTIWT